MCFLILFFNPSVVLGSNLTHFQKVSISEIWVSFNQILKQNNVDGTTLFTSSINDQFTTYIEFGCVIQCYSMKRKIDRMLKNVGKKAPRKGQESDINFEKSDKNIGKSDKNVRIIFKNVMGKAFKKENVEKALKILTETSKKVTFLHFDQEKQKVAWSTGKTTQG